MRHRSLLLRAATLVSGLALAPAAGVATASGPAVPSAVPSTAPAVTRVNQTAAGVTLVTGEHVRLRTVAGRAQVLVDHRATGPGHGLVTRRLGPRTFVMPTSAEPYLGRLLDPNLFDLSSLGAATAGNGRLAVRLTYRGGRPAAPGVYLTSAAGGLARGYLTADSARQFGQALARMWRSDSQAHWPRRATIFGATRISADGSAAPPVRPLFPMLTLVVHSIAADGKPQAAGFLGVVNVDDARKYIAFVVSENGTARISLPAGHYSFVGDDTTFDEKTSAATVRVATVDDYPVTRSGQTVTLDYGKATARSGVSTPRPSTTISYGLEWDRTDAARRGALGAGYGLDSETELRITPAAKPRFGRVALTQSWARASSNTDDPAYTYNVAAIDDHIPGSLAKHFASSRMGVVSAAYYGDTTRTDGAVLRFALFPTTGVGGGQLVPVRRGTVRTEYVGSVGAATPTWTDVALINQNSMDDPGFVDGPTRYLRPASYATVRWFRGPLAPSVPVQTRYPFCYGCRTGNLLTVGLPPFVDSDPTHSGGLFRAEDGLPVTRFRLYRNDILVSDTDDALGGSFRVPAARASYRAVLDVDRRLSEPAQSTRSHTELTFSSTRGTGPRAPRGWYCLGGQRGCRLLPLVQARVALPTDLNGRLPAGRSSITVTVTVTVAPAQAAPHSPATTATLEVRPAGDRWTTVKLTAIGGGRFRGTVDNSEAAGNVVDLRVTGADRAGSSFAQTVLRAYTVADS